MPDLQGLRVCFLAGTLGQGGAERQLYYMLRALKDSGAHPRVLCLTSGEYWEEKIRALGISVIWVGQSSSRWKRLRAIMRELRRQPVDVLQSQHFYTNIYAAAAARFLGLLEIGALRSNGINEVAANGGSLGLISLRAPRAIAANSHQGIENAVRLGMPRSRLHFLPNVVDTCRFSPNGQDKRSPPVRILTIGRMVQAKRLDRFVRVLAAVRHRASLPVRGIIVGDGPKRAQLEAEAANLGLFPDGIEFVGLKASVLEFYRMSDLLLLTSDWEGTPNVVLEAMACGLPVVATNVGDVPDLIRDRGIGCLCPPEDESGLIEAVLALVEDPARRAECGDLSRAFVEQFHAVVRLGDELGRLYDQVGV